MGDDAGEPGGARRRGRRPAGEDARGAILEAARTELAARGYDATSLRGIARAAGVDPRLVHHYFPGGKEEVAAEALALPLRPADLLARLADGPPEELGLRLARTFLGIWDPPERRDVVRGLLLSAASPDGASLLRGFFGEAVLARVASLARAPEPALAASLAAAQLLGVALLRYVIGVEPLASTDAATLAERLAPALQRHLDGVDA